MSSLNSVLSGMKFDGRIKDDPIAVANVAELGNILVEVLGIKDKAYDEEEFLSPVSSDTPLRESDYEHLSSYEIERLCKILGITVKTYQERIKRGLSKREALTVKKHYCNNGNFSNFSNSKRKRGE